jgi:hypothetical protein
MAKSSGSNSVFLLQLSLGIMLLVLGIAGITGANSGLGGAINSFNSAIGGNSGLVATIIAIVKLAAGAFLLLSLFDMVKGDIAKLMLLIILILWAVEMVLNYIINYNFSAFNLFGYLGSLSMPLVVLAGLWTIYDQKV